VRILVVGATGTIGAAVVRSLETRHEVLAAGRSSGLRVDMSDRDSIASLYAHVGQVDAVVCTAGHAAFRPLLELADEDLRRSLDGKLMGQVNLVRLGADVLSDGGSFTLSSGLLSRQPLPGSTALSMVNAAIEGFVRAAALDLPRGLRVNAVSPSWVRETLAAMGRDPDPGVPAAAVAGSYVKCVEGDMTGQVLDVFTGAGDAD
jgi:NAD(P)-dependent dehydrogenase (short-subunit alcohol dehydrogenase family)